MSFAYANLMHMKPNELHNHLMQRNLTTEAREQIKAVVQQQKIAVISQAKHRSAVANQWRPIMEQLRHERESVRSSINYKAGLDNEARATYFAGYKLVLDKLKAELDGYKHAGLTPAKVATDKALLNNGLHWVDWVRPKFIERIMALFAEVPHKKRAKIKEPFMRVVRESSHDEQKAKLRQRTQKELDVSEQNNMVNPTPKNQAKVDRLREAMRRLDLMLPSDPVPRTYSGLFAKGK